ncbi:hypothetical protein N5W20_01220 [Candidatus Kirkpatrickella diaphorinae]|uniref:Lipoprotein n=1 Tax=Candidatus Kirkpatrickella diaphorinae TaxID=2984322 RepID=A0ABY6GKJ3_9PROT|nr:hypothetical protein [Candidatus Kirkpatrickella diaphorinae]UYH51531.1 hypothetical protein N5W20_01220 [Candidatus Kirkpatrickella diaphorinae]
MTCPLMLRRALLALSLLPALAACGAAPQQSSPRTQTSKPFFTNDVSAPRDTPLCGIAAQEANAMEIANYTTPFRTGNRCVQNACFSPLTGSFIAASGYRSVCR